MNKLKTRSKTNGEIVFTSNGMPAVTLDDDGHLHVILPEGVRLYVIGADSGLAARRFHASSSSLIVEAARAAPAPTIAGARSDAGQFTCPRCGSHKFGSWQRGDGQLSRRCHGPVCTFTFPESDDALYFK